MRYISGKLRCGVIHNRGATKIQRDLVAALEFARTRLAVAIACETKSTPPSRRQYYLETADRIRRFTKKLRASSGNLQERREWVRALEALSQVPAQSKALRMCQILHQVVRELSSGTE